jgi:hypothetical protein
MNQKINMLIVSSLLLACSSLPDLYTKNLPQKTETVLYIPLEINGKVYNFLSGLRSPNSFLFMTDNTAEIIENGWSEIKNGQGESLAITLEDFSPLEVNVFGEIPIEFDGIIGVNLLNRYILSNEIGTSKLNLGSKSILPEYNNIYILGSNRGVSEVDEKKNFPVLLLEWFREGYLVSNDRAMFEPFLDKGIGYFRSTYFPVSYNI